MVRQTEAPAVARRPGLARGELEVSTAIVRRFLGIEPDEFIELTVFAEGRVHVAQCSSESEHVRLLREAEYIRGFSGAYMLANGPIDPALGARYEPGRWHRAWNGRATDRDVRSLRAVFLDVDPVRPKGISSTDEQLREAFEVSRAVESWLAEQLGTDMCIGRGCSGNGYFLLVALAPTAPTAETTQRISRLLDMLGKRFGTDSVKIDRAVANPARLMPAPATPKRKGVSTLERPHRLTSFSARASVARIPLEAL